LFQFRLIIINLNKEVKEMMTGTWNEILGMSGKGKNHIKCLCIVLFTVFLFSSVPNNAYAAFDIIVPTDVEIHTTNDQTVSSFGYWGWVVATDNSISLADFLNASLPSAISDPMVSVSQDFIGEFFTAPLDPGEVGGQSAANNAVFNPFLLPGETLNAPTFGFWSITFDFPRSLGHDSGNTPSILTSSITIGGETIDYSTNVLFINDETNGKVITGAQRLSTNGGVIVPEPISTVLFLTGGGIMAGRRYLKKRKKSLI
jgi:hypothetical protein